MTTETLSDGLKIHRKADHTKTVMTHIEKIPQDVIYGFLKIAKGLDKHILLADWTSAHIEREVKPYRDNKEYLIVYLMNKKKAIEGESYSLEVRFGDNKFRLPFLDGQYRNYKDDWNLLSPNTQRGLLSSNSLCYGATTKNYIVLYPDIIDAPIFDRKLFMSAFVKQYLKMYPDLPNENDLKVKKMTQDFQRFIQYGQENLTSQMKSKICEGQREMHNHYTAIQRLEKEVSKEHILLRSFLRKFSGYNAEMKEEKLEKIFESFLKDERYIDIKYQETTIEAFTGNIYCSNYKKKYLVGKFRVVIDLNGTIRMFNLTNRTSSGLHHPHVSAGIPCLGNIKETIPKMIYNGDFIGLFNLLHNFLTSYSEGEPYLTLEQGWGKSEDWCNKCSNPTLNCQCKICSGCGKDEEECECDRCPRYGNLLDEIHCEGCDYYKNKICTY